MAKDISLADLTKEPSDEHEDAGAELSLDNLDATSGASSTTGTALEQSAHAGLDEQIAGLPDQDRKQIEQLSSSIDLTKRGIESTYAKDVQRSTSSFADDVLAKVRSKDTGKAGELLSDLLNAVDDAELGPIRNIPLIGNMFSNAEKLRRRYQKVTVQIDDIISQLEVQQATLVSDIALYDTMYQRNAEQYRQLKIFVLAGRKALGDFETNQLPKLEAEAKESNDPMKAQILTDFKAKLERFSKRLDDLDRVSVVALQTAPQIKIIQNADQMLVDKIDTTITTTIPVWKSQMVIALGLENQRKALDLQKRADDVTNKMLQENAKTLHQGAIAAERANQRAVVDTETLEKVNGELISTLRETVQIQKEGKANREAAQVKMRQLESDLKNALIENAQQMS